MDDQESIRVQLARMEGKLDLSNLRHDQHDTRFTEFGNRLNMHGERISGLETREAERGGERKGLSLAAKAAWAVAGAIPIGVGAVLLRALGA